MKKFAGVVALLLAALFVYMAYTTEIPDRYISTWGSNKMTEYVGGDAYNFIIEAALRGGEISGAMTRQAIFYAVGAVLGVLGLACLGGQKKDTAVKDAVDAQTGTLQAINGALTDVKETLHTVRDHMAERDEHEVEE